MHTQISRKELILAEHVVSAVEAARRMDGPLEDVEAWARRMRERDELFGIWAAEGGVFVYPDFQFGGYAAPAQIKALLTVLRTRAGFDSEHADRGGWARAYWLYQPHPLLSKRALASLDGSRLDSVSTAQALSRIDDTPRTPAETFAEHPAAVIAVAKGLAPQSHP